MTVDPDDLGDLDGNDAEICLRLAAVMERRQSRIKEDQLIVIALRVLADKIMQQFQ